MQESLLDCKFAKSVGGEYGLTEIFLFQRIAMTNVRIESLQGDRPVGQIARYERQVQELKRCEQIYGLYRCYCCSHMWHSLDKGFLQGRLWWCSME